MFYEHSRRMSGTLHEQHNTQKRLREKKVRFYRARPKTYFTAREKEILAIWANINANSQQGCSPFAYDITSWC